MVSRGFVAVCAATTVLVAAFVLVALGNVFLVPVAALRQALAGGALWTVLSVSLQTSVSAALLAVLLGTPVAYVLARKQFFGKPLVETLLDLPVVLPPMVAGLALLILVSPHNPFGTVLARLGVRLIFSRTGIVLAQLFVALPFYIRAVCSAMRAIPPSLPAAAAVLRATEAYAFFHVILPLSREGIISGFVMCWTRALGEFGATAMVAGCIPGVTETLPIAIYTRATAGDLVSAGVAAFCLAAISSVTLVGLRLLFGGSLLWRKA